MGTGSGVGVTTTTRVTSSAGDAGTVTGTSRVTSTTRMGASCSPLLLTSMNTSRSRPPPRSAVRSRLRRIQASRALPFIAQYPVKNHVITPAVAAQMLPVDPFAHEAQTFIQGDGCLVVRKDGQAEPVQVQLVEGEAYEQRHGLAPVSPPPVAFFANADGEEGCAVRPGDAVEAGEAHQQLIFAAAHAKDELPLAALHLPDLGAHGGDGLRHGRAAVVEAHKITVLGP